MNTLKNSVSLIGNLGMDPEVTNFESGAKKVRFSLATNDAYKDKNGEWVTKTEWHNIVAWGKTGELCSKLLKKGSEVMLQGRLEHDTYTDKDGVKRSSTYVNLREFLAINKEKEKAA